MDQILAQLGGLLLRSVPTIFLLLTSFIAYRLLVHHPLQRVLGERRARTEGAIERARADIAAAEAKAAQYEQSLREARAALFKAQEERRRKALEAHAAAVAQARARAQQQVQQARAGIENDKVAAQSRLHAEAARLAELIIQAILRPAAAVSTPIAGGRQ